jgi:putative hydrolase of the HAD superfamily
MRIRGILLDIGDTLIGATELQARVLQDTVEIVFAKAWCVSAATFLKRYQDADNEVVFDQIPDLNHLFSDKRIVERALVLCFQQKITHFLATYRELLRKQIRSDPDLIRLMRDLRKRGLRLGVVSNGTTIEQQEQLERLGIKRYLDPIIISQEVGIRKPDPRIFLLAADYWQLPPRQILVVGDRGDWEIIGAHRAGMLSALTTQFIDRRDTILPEAQPQFIIGNLRELLDIVRKELP